MASQLEDWLALIECRHPTTIDMGLTRVEAVRRQLELTLPMPVVLIGGTNGKGSVSALMEAMLLAAGFRVGCYTSPHFLRFNERLRLNGVEVIDTAFIEAFERVENACQQAAVSLTYFEFTTLAAAYIIASEGCDCALLEVGLGGRLDAVNIFSPAVSVVTSIGLDHCEYLGDTIDSIAVEKAGIFRCGQPAIVGQPTPPATLLASAREVGAILRTADVDFTGQMADGHCWHYQGQRRLANLPLPSLQGRHQINNASCALAALESLPADYWPGIGAVRQGLQTVQLSGRGQVLAGQPTVVLDVAHNAQAATVLERFLFDMGYYPHTAAILGVMKNKNIKNIVNALAPRVDNWYAVKPTGGDDSLKIIADAVNDVGGRVDVCTGGVAEAWRMATAKSGKNDRIVISGSFLTVADFLRISHER